MSDEFNRGFVGMLYLMNVRGQVLRDCAPSDEGTRGVVEGLCDPDRTVRTRWLARCLRDIMSDLSTRELN